MIQSTQYSDLDRRNSVRAPLYTRVETRDGGALWTRDIGLGGMQCRTSRVRFPGQYLDLSFTLPRTKEPIIVGAQVATLVEADADTVALGLRFCRLTHKAQMQIYRFLDDRRGQWELDSHVTRLAKSLGVAIDPRQRPFESLLHQAYASLGLDEEWSLMPLARDEDVVLLGWDDLPMADERDVYEWDELPMMADRDVYLLQ